MEEKKELKVIDLYIVGKRIWAGRKLFAKTLPIAFVVACIFILGFPRYYTTDVKLAPELGGTSISSSLGSLASSFGLDLDKLQSNDAITPLLYPDLIDDNSFVAGLLKVNVKTIESDELIPYYDYLKKRTKPSWWAFPLGWIKSLFKKSEQTKTAAYSPYHITKEENEFYDAVRNNVKISFDKKTAIITIEVTAQDPLVSKIMADSIKDHIQIFITNYRTSKARNDFNYYSKLTKEAKNDYEKARQRYANSADANTKVALRSVEMALEDMENDLQLKFNAYTTVSTQMQASKAKVQERTPAFTTIKGAAVPVKPSGPKRMIFVAVCLILTFIGTTIYVNIKDIQR